MDTFYDINFDKSIKKQRLVYKLTAGVVFEYCFTYFGAIMTMGAITVPAVFKPVNISHISIFYILFCVAIDTWIIANMILLNAFVKIEGKQKDVNAKDIINTLSCSYALKNVDTSDSNIIRIVELTGLFTFGNVITCVLYDNYVYLNVTTLLRGDAFSFISGVYNYYNCKSIAKKFTTLQSNRLKKIQNNLPLV